MTQCKQIDARFLVRGALFGGLMAGMLICAGLVYGATPTALSDQAIADAVDDEFYFDAAVRPDLIDVTSREGVITLNGVTDNILAKERAAQLARTVKGVRSVVNNIKVRPPIVKSAAALTADVRTALTNDPAADAYEITVRADDRGKVTLSGTVDSWQETKLAETVAKGVAGVTDVENDLKIDYGAGIRRDSEIRTEIERRLYWDVLVDSGLIEVEVDDGKVALSGIVGSAAELSRAVYDAYVRGVIDVDSSKLAVQNWARNPDRRDPAYTFKSDKEIATAVKDALLYDPRVELSNIDVEVSDGAATLRGSVDSLAAKRSAEQDARNTLGVDRVINRIKVKAARSDPDDKVASRVKEALQRDPYVDKHEISVIVNGGIVKLYGAVDTYFEKGRADYAVERVNGVIGVDNNLTVRNTHRALIYHPYVSYYPPYLYPWYDYVPTVSHRTDLEIRDNIKRELWWSPFVDSDEVTVSVVNARATLTGEVDSLSEWLAAAESAWEGGAIWVVNDLEIDRGKS